MEVMDEEEASEQVKSLQVTLASVSNQLQVSRTALPFGVMKFSQ